MSHLQCIPSSSLRVFVILKNCNELRLLENCGDKIFGMLVFDQFFLWAYGPLRALRALRAPGLTGPLRALYGPSTGSTGPTGPTGFKLHSHQHYRVIQVFLIHFWPRKFSIGKYEHLMLTTSTTVPNLAPLILQTLHIPIDMIFPSCYS